MAWLEYVDAARSGLAIAARAALRWQPSDALELRAGYALRTQSAADPVFAATVHRLRAGAELRLARDTYLGAAYDLEIGDEVFYLPLGSSVPPSGPRMRRGMDSTFGSVEEVIRSPATAHSLSAVLEVPLWKGIYAALSYSHAWVQSAAGDYRAQTFASLLGYRL